MRLRSLVGPAVLACVAAAVLPASALAAPAQCSVVAPTKVVIDAPTESSTFRVASNCAAHGMDIAHWELAHAGGGSIPLDFSDVAPSRIVRWYDDDPKGTWTSTPVEAAKVGGAPLTQNTAVTRVKYAARLSATVKRTSAGLSWTAAATQWSGARHTWVPRPRVTVALFHLPSGSTTWKYVKSVTASSTGRATVTLGSPKSGSYRLVTGETPTVWAGYSTSVRGRI